MSRRSEHCLRRCQPTGTGKFRNMISDRQANTSLKPFPPLLPRCANNIAQYGKIVFFRISRQGFSYARRREKSAKNVRVFRRKATARWVPRTKKKKKNKKEKERKEKIRTYTFSRVYFTMDRRLVVYVCTRVSVSVTHAREGEPETIRARTKSER